MSLKFKMHGQSILNNNIEKLVLNIVFWSFGALALWYVFILGNMVSDIVQRRTLESDARILSKEVADLELRYLSAANTIDLDFSHALGFKETKANFTTRKPLGSLSGSTSISPSAELAKNEI